MRRGGNLRRTTGLRSNKPLVARTELVRHTPFLPSSSLSHGGGLRRVPFRAQKPTVTPAERRARKLVRARSGGICEICRAAPATNFQHRLPKSAKSDGWCPSNGIDVCGAGNATGCHGAIHQRPQRAYDMGWSVRRGQDPAKTPCWLAQREFVLLDAQGGVTPINDVPDEESA